MHLSAVGSTAHTGRLRHAGVDAASGAIAFVGAAFSGWKW
jgi:hypothetical protein